MTLLNLGNLESIENRIPHLEKTYQSIVGMPVYEFCARAVGAELLLGWERAAVKVASVPVTAGGGLIGNFAGIVAEIVAEFAGVESFVTERTDVAGFQEAVLAGADVVFMADDDVCMAYNVHTGKQSDNSEATGRVFAALLECAAGDLAGEEVLVLGMGKVGQSAYLHLEQLGARVRWFDVNPPANASLNAMTCCPGWAKRPWRYIVDCTTAPELVEACNVESGGIVSAPGIPFGLTAGACDSARLVIHDELESGIVAMLCEVM